MRPYIEKKVLVTVVSRYMLMNSMNLGLLVFLLTFLIIFNFVKYRIGLPVVDLLELCHLFEMMALGKHRIVY